MSTTFPVTDADFEDQVINSDQPVVVDFWAEWCGPCKMIAPILEEAASEYAEKLAVIKLNIDESGDPPDRAGEVGLHVFKRHQEHVIVAAAGPP